MYLPPPASYRSVGAEMHRKCFGPSTATSRSLPIKSSHFRVTSSHMTLCNIISCHVTATSCKLQSWRSWNTPKTWVFGFLQPLPGLFRLNQVTSSHVTSFLLTWLPRPVSYSPIEAEMCQKREFYSSTATARSLPVKLSHLRVTSGHTRSHDITSCHVTATSCELQPSRHWNAT